MQLPVGGLPHTSGQRLTRLLRAAPALVADLVHAPRNLSGDPHFGPDTAAPRSSRGPTFDNRIKPDVLAPGDPVRAADGASDCGLAAAAGTSPAAAVAAGALALARQYFVDGYYPTGARAAGDGFAPGAALLRAVAVNSAVPMAGLVDVTGRGGWASLPGHPLRRYIEGHGRLELATGLPFADADTPLRLFVAQERALGAAEAHAFCVDARAAAAGGVAVSATVAWVDPPAGVQFVVNDLDLVVLGPDGKVCGPSGCEQGREVRQNKKD